jgi:outer membrane receptor protein involved in Fe transport
MEKLILLFLTSLCINLVAQENVKVIRITGKIIEKKTNIPLEFATVTVQNLKDKKVITGAITDNKGVFEVQIIPGIYTIKAEFIGLKSFAIDTIHLQTSQSLATLYLEEDAKLLEAVEVKADKTSIEYKLDKKIFNVGSDIITKGGSATDILNNVPSVSVNSNGAVSLRGNSGVRILINGKPSVLTTNNGLEQIPSETIEKIEVITNPSSKYDSEGTAGIINIILKKNKVSGFSNSIQVTTGVPSNHAFGYNVSYKTSKINLFSDLRYRYIDFIGKESSLRTNYVANIPDSYLASTVNRNRNNKTFTIYFGGDYYFNDKNTLTLSYYHRNNISRNKVDYTFDFFNKNYNLQRLITASENYKEPQKSNQIELNYIKNFSKEGKKFTVNLQYDFWNDDEQESIIEQEKSPIELPIRSLKSRDIESSKDFLFQTDYALPLTKKSIIEFGAKTEIRQINSEYEVFDSSVLIDSLNNLLRYNEQILGAYIQYGSSIKKFQYQLGVRVENSVTGSSDELNQFNIQKKYTNFFPTTHFTYRINDAFNIQLSYSKRISRPGFWQLNPFGGIADRRNMRIGNPDLNPMFTNSYELGTLIRWKKFTINPSMYHQFSENIFNDIRIPNASGFLIEKAINSGTESRIGTEISISYSPLKWLTLSGEANYYSFEQKGVFTVSDNAFTSRLNSRVKFSTWNFQTNINYIGAKYSGQVNSDSQYWFDFGMGKDIWKEKASITFKIDNVFDSRILKGVVIGNEYDLNYNLRNVGPRIYATFTYRINRKKSEKDRLPD